MTCGDADKLIQFDYVAGQTAAIDAPGIQAHGARRKARGFRRPVAKKHDSFPAIDVVPGQTSAAGRVRTNRSHLGQIAGHLPLEWYTRTYSGMHDQMRSKVDSEGQ